MAKQKPKLTKAQEQLTERRSLLDIGKKEGMLAVLIRNQSAYEAVDGKLEPKHIRTFSEPLAVIWSAVTEFYKKFEYLPYRGQLEDEINDRVAANPDLILEDERGEVDELVEYIYDDEYHGANLSKSKKHVETALENCRLFLQELAVSRVQERLQSGAMVPVYLPAVLEANAAEFADIETIVAKPSGRVFEPGWDEEPSALLVPYGVDPLDKMLGGGPAGGEVNLFMAPYGVCKTTLGTIITYNRAEDAAMSAASRTDGRHPMSVIVSTEMTKREFRERILVYGGKIPRKRVRAYLAKQMEWSDFSNAKRPASSKETQYEKYLMETANIFKDGYVCEQERLDAAMKIANKHILFIDFSSSNLDHKHVGTGGMRELSNVIKAEIRRNPAWIPCNFVIDHISAMADRMLDSGQYDRHDLTTILQNMPRQARDWMGLPYDSSVLLFHQYSGAANAKRSPAAKLHHSDAAGCKSIGMYCDFAFMCGHPTEEPNAMQIAKWECTKHRREPPSEHMLVGIDGTYHRLTDQSHTHVVQGNTIVESTSTVRESGRARNAKTAYDLEVKTDSQARKGVRV